MFEEQLIKSYREFRSRSQHGIEQIRGGMSFWEAAGSEPLRNVTDRRLRELSENVEMMDRLIRYWERRLPH
jgi:hypothetical protein